MKLLKSVTTIDKCLFYFITCCKTAITQSRNNEHAHLAYTKQQLVHLIAVVKAHRHSATAITADKTDTQTTENNTVPDQIITLKSHV